MAPSVQDPAKDKDHTFRWLVAVIVIAAFIGLATLALRTTTGNVLLNALEDRGVTEVDMAVTTTDDGAVRFTNAQGTNTAPQADVFSDLQCPYCAELHATDQDSMQQAIESGDLTTDLHMLTFLDSQGHGPSTMGAAAIWTAAQEGNATAAWTLWDLMMVHQDLQMYWEVEEYAEALTHLGISHEHVATFQESYGDIGDQLGETNRQELDSRGQGTTVPQVYVDGQNIELTDVTGSYVDWVQEIPMSD